MWLLDNKLKEQFKKSKEREEWSYKDCFKNWEKIKTRIESQYQDENQIGPLRIEHLNEEEYFFCYPLSHAKIQGIILGNTHEIKILNAQGEWIFEGLTEQLPPSVVLQDVYVWMKTTVRGHGLHCSKRPWYLRFLRAFKISFLKSKRL